MKRTLTRLTGLLLALTLVLPVHALEPPEDAPEEDGFPALLSDVLKESPGTPEQVSAGRPEEPEAGEAGPEGEDADPSDYYALEPVQTLAAPPAAEEAGFAGGSGTEDDPYQIETAEQFCRIRPLMAEHQGAYFYFLQTDDLDLKGIPTGSYPESLSGVYNGGGYRVFNTSAALFMENAANSVIRNIRVENCDIRISRRAPETSARTTYVGGIVEYNLAAVENCSVSGSIAILSDHQPAVGGIAGYCANNAAVISGCVNFADIQSSSYAGGILGSSYNLYKCSIQNCYNLGRVQASVYGGGIAGCLAGRNREMPSVVSNCYDNGSVISGGSRSGRIIGRTGEFASAVNCYYVGEGLPNDGSGTTGVSADAFKGGAGALLLNGSGGSAWEGDQHGINDRFPVLAWQNELHSSVTASPDPDQAYTDPITVELAGNKAIFYTLDGSNPRSSSSSAQYTGPISIGRGNTTLRVWAEGEKGDARFTYHVALYPVTPTLPAGTYTGAQGTLLSSQEGGEIYYTTDGSDPRTSASRSFYSGDFIKLNRSLVTVTAAVLKDGVWGDPWAYEYTLIPDVILDPQPGRYSAPTYVTLSTSLTDCRLYYSTDGSDPHLQGALSDGEPILLLGPTDLKVSPWIANNGYPAETYHYDLPETVITPSREPGAQSGAFQLSFSYTGLSGLQLYVSRDGGEYQPYTGPLDIYKNVNLSVQARWQDNPVATSSFRYTLPALVLTASPQEGTYTLSQGVALSCNLPGYSIAYALDGGEPVPYTGPIPVQRSVRLTAYAQYKGETVGERTFAYTLNLPELTASQDSGTKANPIDVALTCSQSGFQILYTLDGSDPRESGNVYSAPIHLDRPAELRAVPMTTVNGERRYGAEKRWQYDFEGLFTVKSLTVTPQAGGYALSATLDNRYPESRGAFLLAAGYDAAGRLTETKLFPAVSAAGGTAALSSVFTPSKDLSSFRVFALERNSWQPLAAPVLNSRVFTGLRVFPASITGKQGTSQSVTVTAQYSDGTTRALGSGQYTATSSNSSAATLSGGSVYLAGGGSAVITVSYTEGGITKTAQISVSSQEQTLTGISVSPASFSGAAGGSQYLSVTAQYSDGTSRALSAGQYTATSSNSSVASVSNGRVHFVSPGFATLKVSYTENGVTKTASAGVSVLEPVSTPIQRLVSFLRTQPEYTIEMASRTDSGSVGVTFIKYDAAKNRVVFQFNFFGNSGGGGWAAFWINAATGAVDTPIAAVIGSNNSTILWSGAAESFRASTYYHSGTTLYFSRVTGVSSSTRQELANSMLRILVIDSQQLLTGSGAGVTLGQLGFNRYS